ncbi:MAG: MBL fold metallo-hydrolase [Deltaproteobacteria bacterium]
MRYGNKLRAGAFIAFLAMVVLLLIAAVGSTSGPSTPSLRQVSDHFDGELFFNPPDPPSSESAPARPSNRGISRYLWRWLISDDRPDWPEMIHLSPGPRPAERITGGTIRITPVGHATFLIQMDGVNILTDPIWSERCSPVFWAGPRRRQPPGLQFEDLPPLDAVLLSHNHYDHLDLPTLRRLAARGTTRALAPLGNRELISGAEIPDVTELDWWQSVTLANGVKLTLVPAQHFSSRSPWDRNETLWGGFVITGPSGNIYYAGDTGYGPHFQEIARRFSPIRAALLPISPYRARSSNPAPPAPYTSIHMSPPEAVQAHIDLGASLSIAAHFQVFQLGWDGFDDAVNELSANLKKRTMPPDAFLTPMPGRPIDLNPALAGKNKPPGMTISVGAGPQSVDGKPF